MELLPWAAAGLALFMLGRLFPLRAEVTHSSARQLPPVRTADLTAVDRGSRPSIAAFVGVQVKTLNPDPGHTAKRASHPAALRYAARW